MKKWTRAAALLFAALQVDDGVTPTGFISAWYEAATRYGKGELTKEAALQEFLEKCAK